MQSNPITELKNILYVEDDFDDQQFFQESLEAVAPNTNCYIANDVAEARELFKEIDVALDYIFLDINMPWDGWNNLYKRDKKTGRFEINTGYHLFDIRQPKRNSTVQRPRSIGIHH